MRARLAWLILCAGCSNGPTGPLTVSAAEYDPLSLALSALGNGAEVHLQIPPQGGVVLFIGARVLGLGGGKAQLDARLSSGATLVGEDRRASSFVRDGDGDGFVPPLDSYLAMANVPVCPSGGVVSVDLTTTLEVTVTEVDSGRHGSTQLTVTPRCLQDDAGARALCQCECAADFMPGHC